MVVPAAVVPTPLLSGTTRRAKWNRAYKTTLDMHTSWYWDRDFRIRTLSIYMYVLPARSKRRRFVSTDGQWQKEQSKEVSKEQYLSQIALVVALSPYTNRPVKRPHLNPLTHPA